MSWDKLNPSELQATRLGLHLSIKEASEWIAGHTSPRTWQRYESGDNNIPADIHVEMEGLVEHAEKLFEDLHDQAFQAEKSSETLTLNYYKDQTDWIAENGEEYPINWRAHQSVAARIFREFRGNVVLI